MSRIAATFEALKKDGRRALIPYVTAGFPYADITPELMHGMVAAGADASVRDEERQLQHDARDDREGVQAKGGRPLVVQGEQPLQDAERAAQDRLAGADRQLVLYW